MHSSRSASPRAGARNGDVDDNVANWPPITVINFGGARVNDARVCGVFDVWRPGAATLSSQHLVSREKLRRRGSLLEALLRHLLFRDFLAVAYMRVSPAVPFPVVVALLLLVVVVVTARIHEGNALARRASMWERVAAGGEYCFASETYPSFLTVTIQRATTLPCQKI